MLLTGPGLSGAPWTGGDYELGECRVCHRAETSCNPCHHRVGAPRVKLLAPPRRPGEGD